MPIIPASPRNSAHSDHPNAASVPTEINVSIVAVPWRALVHAARWKGSAPHTTTGAANVSDIHCQASNCRAGIIPMATTGIGEDGADQQAGRAGSESGSVSAVPAVVGGELSDVIGDGGSDAW